MTITSKRLMRPLVVAAAFAVTFAILPSSPADHGALFGFNTAMARGHSSAGHDGIGGMGADRADASGIGQGAPRNGGVDAADATHADPRDIANGVDEERPENQVLCAWSGCR